jgi:hypothetical protein
VGTFSPTPQKADFEISLIEQENVHTFASVFQARWFGLRHAPPQRLLNVLLNQGDYLLSLLRRGVPQLGSLLLQRGLAEVVSKNPQGLAPRNDGCVVHGLTPGYP